MNTTSNTLTAPLRAFHGDPAIKEQYLARVRAHKAADEIASGFYWENGKGCAVGCTIHGSSHARYETELGIPRRLAYIEDRFFERLYGVAPVRAKEWPERFLSAPNVGADLTLVWPRFALWFLLDSKDGAIQRARSPEIFSAVTKVGELYKQWVDTGERPELALFRAASVEARRLSRTYWDRYWAADAAAAADAADAADAAAAADAADADRYSRAWRETYDRVYRERLILSSDKLIELMQQAPVTAAA